MQKQEHSSLGTTATSDLAQLVDSSNQFAFDLYSKLREETSGNLFMSPSSVIFALAMTYAGAKNETARQMASVLRFDLPSDRLHEALRALRANTRTGGIELRIANRLWAQKGYHVLAEFLDTTERCYGTQLGEVDFRTSAEKARQQINRWI